MALDDLLVSATWLLERLADPMVKPVDASWWFPHEQRNAALEFEAGHIPGAVFFDIDAIADPDSPLPHMLPQPPAFADAVGSLGLGDEHLIVVYEAAPPRSAARAWWSFKAMGHDRVVVLDGGLPLWKAVEGPIETGAALPQKTVFTPRPATLVRSAEDVLSNLGAPNVQILDARPAPRFRGEAAEPRAGLKSGHMPGALNLPAGSLYQADGRMASKAELARIFESLGVDGEASIIATCGSGITACTIALALARLGRSDWAVYDGSWAEWGALAKAPVVVG